jgi:uncharacterized protein
MPRLLLPLRAVAATFLQRQHLASPRSVPLTAARLRRFVEDVGGVQLDSINVVDRAHHLTLWSRFGPYDRTTLDRLVYERRVLFEYWAHAACLVPTSALRWWRRAMLDYRVRHTGWSAWLKRNPRTVARVLEAVRANGPMTNSEFASTRRARIGSWWSWKPAQHALHYLWMTGALAVKSRRHFQKRFDLFERVIPGVGDLEVATPEAFARWHVERSLAAMGAATEADLAGYLTFPRFLPRVRREALQAMLETGRVVEIAVEGSVARWIALAGDVAPLRRAADAKRPAHGTTMLCPFDSLLWSRERVARLFGFQYRIEVYTRAADRIHGYYTMPILHDGELIGRVDAKAHRAERRLEIRHVHFEPWFAAGQPSPTAAAALDVDAALAGVSDALASLAAFVGADAIRLRRVTPSRLRGALATVARGRP